MTIPYKKSLNRRQFIQLAGISAAAAALAACTPAKTATTEPTAPATAVPTATSAPVATATPSDPWAIYPDTDPRHWVLDKVINPAKKYPNLEITQNYWMSTTNFKEGETVADNVTTRWIKDQMGLYYKPVWSGSDQAQYWGPALASGDLAEFMTVIGPPQYLQLREADMLVDITDIWEKTASDLTKEKKKYKQDKLYWKFVTEEGRIYGIPTFGGGAHNGEDILWVRQDWLDQVGMKIPQTLDEVAAVGKAFKKAGLGKFGLWVGNLLGNTWGALTFVFGSFGTMPLIWRRQGDGKLAYSSLEPAQKQALELIAGWYKDGLLDPEFLTAYDVAKNAGGNLAGMVMGPWWLSLWPLPDSVKNDPKAKWACGHIPAGSDGKRGRFGDQYVGNLSGFRKGIDPIKIEATIEMLNWVYEMEENQKSGYAGMGQFLQYFGYDYEMENGIGKVGKYGTARMAGGAFDFNTDRYEECDIKYLTIASELSKQDPSMLNPLQILAINDPTGLYMKSAESIKIGFDDAQYNIYNDFIWPMPSQATELMTSLNALEIETYANIITGKAPVSAWDAFASDWMKQGGDEVTQLVNQEDAKHV